MIILYRHAVSIAERCQSELLLTSTIILFLARPEMYVCIYIYIICIVHIYITIPKGPNGQIFLGSYVSQGPAPKPIRQPRIQQYICQYNISATYSLCTGERCDVSREWPRTGNMAFSCEKHNKRMAEIYILYNNI